jgi:hypothetical protein
MVDVYARKEVILAAGACVLNPLRHAILCYATPYRHTAAMNPAAAAAAADLHSIVSVCTAVLCSYESPHLLLKSGIGGVEALRDANIEPVAAREGVGENLKDHPIVGERGSGASLCARACFCVCCCICVLRWRDLLHVVLR